MREKLIELLAEHCSYKKQRCVGCDTGKHYHPECKTERFGKIADHLIANGVTIADDRPRFFIGQNQMCKEELAQIIGSGPVILSVGEDSIIPIHPGRWIPVTERLPESVDSYLVVVKCKYDWEKEYDIDVDVATYNPYEKAYIDDCWNTYNDWDEGQQYIHVTHWMPLPEPPKEGE